MTQPTFNLIDEPWIPCVTSTGERQLLGLESTLVRAHEMWEIYDDSPLVTVTLHRLLLAVLHHLLQGPENMAAWSKLWCEGTGRFDAEQVHAYLHDEHRHRRFDLFDPEWPFYQCSQLPFATAEVEKDTIYAKSVAKLAAELAAGNNDTLFDYSIDIRPMPITAATAARLVVACQGFSMGGTVTYEQKKDKSADASPLVKGAVAIIRGDNLFQTLLLNLHAYDGKAGQPFRFKPKADLPAWERREHTKPRDRKLNGYLDLLTWQSRRIRLKPDVDEDGTITVATAVVMKGEQFLDGFHRHSHETMVAFTHNKAATAKQDPFPAVGFTEDRSLWRSSLALFQNVSGQQSRPKTIGWIDDLRSEDRIPLDRVFPMDLFGLSSDQAKVLLWRHEHLPLSLRLISSPSLLLTLQEALARTENVRRVLWQATSEFARVLMLQDESKQPGKEQKKDIQNVVASLGVERRYWASLEPPFHGFLADLGARTPPEDQELDDAALADWNTCVKTVATTVFGQAISSEGNSARSLKAAVYAERRFRMRLPAALCQSKDTATVTAD
tara:strand:- start:61570 stop:63231 length:1662 start_codon:yes stop_codon:yes gene_type:complete